MNNRVRARPLLGTYVEVGVCSASPRVDKVIDQAFGGLELIQSLMSFHDPKSELSQLNSACGCEVKLHFHTATVLRHALDIGKRSNGLFNCMVGGKLVNLGILPNHSTQIPLDCGCDDDLEIIHGTAKLTKPLRISLDGIAKGYAVDFAVSILQRSGVESGWVNAGGDLRAFGEAILSVRRRDSDGNIKKIGDLQNAALATSSVFVKPDPRYPGHIVQPSAGPRIPGTWSVKAPSAWLADALTKVACLAATDLERRVLVSNLGGQLV